MTGLSRAQVTRLIARYGRCGRIEVAPYRRHRFPQRYTRADVELLAWVDEAHENLSGPATRRILEREYQLHGKPEYARLAAISGAHLYNLRQQPRYRERRLCYVKTRPTAVAIGERRPPDAQGRPGFLRIDTVHQGDAPGGAKGVYHINAVDEVTQWQIVAATPHISEAWLEPLLEAMIRQFPFRILGFHSDNGSEYINAVIARLPPRSHTKQTKSPPRHSNDNGLVETKNGAVIRKHMGYGYIHQAHAQSIQNFYAAYFNPSTIVPALKPTLPSTRRAAGAACTAVIKPRWKLCWPCPGPRNTCVPVSPSPACSAWPRCAATPKPRNACSTPSVSSWPSASSRQPGRGNDGSGKSPENQNRGIPRFLGKRDTPALPTFPPPRRLLYWFQNPRPKSQTGKEPFLSPCPFPFRLILRLEKTRRLALPKIPSDF